LVIEPKVSNYEVATAIPRHEFYRKSMEPCEIAACEVCGPSKWHDGVVGENEGRLVLDPT